MHDALVTGIARTKRTGAGTPSRGIIKVTQVNNRGNFIGVSWIIEMSEIIEISKVVAFIKTTGGPVVLYRLLAIPLKPGHNRRACANRPVRAKRVQLHRSGCNNSPMQSCLEPAVEKRARGPVSLSGRDES